MDSFQNHVRAETGFDITNTLKACGGSFPPELGFFFHLLNIDSDRYTSTIHIVTGVWLDTHIKPHSFLLFFFLTMSRSRGVSCPYMVNLPLLSCGI